MKYKNIAIFWAVAIMILGIWNTDLNVNAEEVGETIDFSYLLTDGALIGYMDNQTWGIYLAEGNSIINKISTTKIGAGGITNAAKKCEVSITSIVERKTTSGSWVRVTSWTQTNQNAFTAAISKSLTVGTGYYYRVRSSHYAATDASSSYTDALKM